MPRSSTGSKTPAKASTKPAATKKPAASPAKKTAMVTLADLAQRLGVKDKKALRGRIRRLRGGAQVGKGGRYEWKSVKDPDYVKLLKELSK